jgi:hypothetical protein
MFFGTSHLDQRYLGDDPTGSAAQDPNAPQSDTAPGTVPPGTLIPAPILTPTVAPATGITALIAQHKPLLTVLAVAAIVYLVLKSQAKK